VATEFIEDFSRAELVFTRNTMLHEVIQSVSQPASQPASQPVSQFII
jgi:hypothetical protein